jgi:hypothetical protein
MVRSVWPAVTPYRWQLAAETWGNLMSIIKAYTALEHLLAILHRNQYSYQGRSEKCGRLGQAKNLLFF